MKMNVVRSVTEVVLIVALIVVSLSHLMLQTSYIRVLGENQKLKMKNLQMEFEVYKLKHSLKATNFPKREIEVEVTAYCPCEKCCGEYADGLTATGKDAYTKGVAVDPKVIPLGSTIHIPGYGTVEADDVGGAIKGAKIDVRFRTHKEAKQWGRQKRRITILR